MECGFFADYLGERIFSARPADAKKSVFTANATTCNPCLCLEKNEENIVLAGQQWIYHSTDLGFLK